MKNKVIAILCVIIIILMNASFTFAEAEDSKNAANSKRYDPTSSSMQELPYYDENINNANIAKYRDNYSLDINIRDDSFFSGLSTDSAMNGVSNTLFQMQRGLVESIIFMCDKAFNFQSYDIFKGAVSAFIKKMYRGTYRIILTIMISLIGIFFFLKYMQGKNVEFWTSLLQIVVVIALAILYFTEPISLLSRVDSVMNNVTNSIFESTMDYNYIDSTSSPAEIIEYEKTVEEIENYKNKNIENPNMIPLANMLWDQYVHIPWRLMEFGNEELADIAEDDILALSPNDPERVEVIEAIEDGDGKYKGFEGYSSQELATKRLGFMMMYFIPLLLSFLLIAILCIVLIGYQFLVVLLFLIGIFVFMVALIPSVGIRVVKDWFLKVLGTALVKIMLTFLLIVMITLNQALFEFAGENQFGWLGALLLQFVIYIVIYWKRKLLFDLIEIGRESVYKTTDFSKKFEGKGFKIPEYFSKPIIRPAVRGIASTWSETRALSKERASEFKKTAAIANANEKIVVDDGGETWAGNYLQKKYQYFKKAAEKKAKMHGESPAYNPFVDTVRQREKRNEPRFTEDEVNQVIKRRDKIVEYKNKRKKRNNIKSPIIEGRIRKDKERS